MLASSSFLLLLPLQRVENSQIKLKYSNQHSSAHAGKCEKCDQTLVLIYQRGLEIA